MGTEVGGIIMDTTKAEQRAKSYVEIIYELIDQIPDAQKNEVVKKVNAKLMLLPEYWDEPEEQKGD